MYLKSKRFFKKYMFIFLFEKNRIKGANGSVSTPRIYFDWDMANEWIYSSGYSVGIDLSLFRIEISLEII